MSDRYLIAGCLLVLLAMGTYARNQEWQSPVVLWQSAADLAPHHARPKINLARLKLAQGKTDEALAEYFAVLKDLQEMDRSPTYANFIRSAALTNIGLIRIMSGRFPEGERYLDLVIAENPTQPYALINRGMARLAMNRCSEAMQDFEAARARLNVPCS